MALVPSSKNPEFGPDLEGEMARLYAQLGDADHAIPMLTRLLRTSYPSATFLTPATLRLDPIWDSIRNDPRFQKLTAETAPLPEKSIAVLPFENLSKDEENAFFAGGVQDEILTNLAIDQVAATLQIPSDLNYGKLRLHPFWDRCAVIRASTRSLPQLKLPADNSSNLSRQRKC